MYKIFIKKLPYFLIVIFTFFYSNYLFSQDLITYSSDELLGIGIDPNNYQQVIDSLASNSLRTRSLVIEYCGEMKIYDSMDELKILLENTLFPENPPYQYSFTERAKILFSLVELEDSTIQEELRDAIMIMSEDSLNIFYLSFFSRYVMQKFNDDFGWQYIKPFYELGSSQLFDIDVYYLKNFLNSNVSGEVVSVLRNLALTDYRAENRITAINYLADINDEEVVNIITQASVNDPDKMNRFLARENLKKVSYDSYIDLLKSALETETEYRLFIYDGLLRSGRPSVYKYVVDLYKSNQYPADINLIEEELENQWLLQPKEEETVTILLDSLSSALFQFNSFGWLGDVNFVNELNNYVLNSNLFFVSNDTINAESQMNLMREKIDFELRDTTDLTNKFVKLEAWKYLYPRTYFIEKRINRVEYSDSLVSLEPSSVVAGSPPITAHIIGSGFGYGTLLFWNDNDYLDYSIISPTEIMVVIPDSFLSEPSENTISASNYLSYSTNRLSFYVLQSTVVDVSEINPAMSLVNPGAFTMEVKGSGFSSSSVVYFNGNLRATTFVSDSTLNAQILSTDVSAAGNFPVWVSDNALSSDTLIYKVVSTLPQPVRPVLECVTNNGDGTYTAFFGYKNENNISVYIPVGSKNKFTPNPQDRGQTRVFKPGRQIKVYTVNFNGSNLVWTLNGRTSTASANSAPCQ